MKKALTEEELKRLLEKFEDKTEVVESLVIQCDVWRSKFLASKYVPFYYLSH